jgi:aminopeptidase
MTQSRIDLYAKFIVERGVDLQKGQTFRISCPVEAADFARMCAKHAYALGAREVVVNYGDEKLSRMKMEHADAEALADAKPWILASCMDYYTGPGSVARLAIYAEDPELYKGLDTDRVDSAMQAQMKLMRPWMELSMGNKMQWCVVCVPVASWAKRLFPELDEAAAMEKLWEAILTICRVEENGDPAAEWQEAIVQSAARQKRLNEMNLSALHMVGENGTDITVGLADDYHFEGLSDEGAEGTPNFLANIPSAEIFTAPHKDRVDGIVKSSLPYVYNGNIIKGITARFENGRAVEVSAEEGNDVFQDMMKADEGARHLGEIALVPASSPIRQSGILFLNTLYDENAACHMAFGKGYPSNIIGGREMSQEQLAAKGLNDSIIHEDVMIGTEKMNITGIKKDGTKEAIFIDGEWAF